MEKKIGSKHLTKTLGAACNTTFTTTATTTTNNINGVEGECNGKRGKINFRKKRGSV